MTSLDAAHMHRGDTWHYRPGFDLTVAHVEVDGTNAAVLVAEYSFLLHVPAAQVLDVDVAVTP